MAHRDTRSAGRPPGASALRTVLGGEAIATVPFGVGFPGRVTSPVGHALTGRFETAFQVIPGVGALPSERAARSTA